MHSWCGSHSTSINAHRVLGVGGGGKGEGRSSSLQEGVSHTYTLKLGYSRNYILYQKPQVRLILDFVKPIKRLNYKNFKLYSKYLCV